MRSNFTTKVKLSFFGILLILVWRTGRFYCENQRPIHENIDIVFIKTSSSATVISSTFSTHLSSSLPTLSSSTSILSSRIVLRSQIPKGEIIRAAVVLSLSKQTSHIAEFHLLYESWRFLQIFSPLSEQVIIDLIVFCEMPSCYQLPLTCIPISSRRKFTMTPHCLYEKLEHRIVWNWKDYLYMTSIAFMLTTSYQQATKNYDWILRVDQDALLSPGLLLGLARKHPIKLLNIQFGGIGHGTDFTNNRLRTIAKKLGYKHVGIHNLCSTWLVSPLDSIRIANMTTHIGRYLLQNEFGRHVPGIEDLPAIGEWPKWWRGVTSLYAGEIAINHLYSSTLGRQHESSVLDHPADSQNSLWDAWHIHCLHNPTYFSKFQHRIHLFFFVYYFQASRIRMIKNYFSVELIVKQIIDEFEAMYIRNETVQGQVTVRDYVTVLAWRKAYAASGAINL